MKPLLAIIVLLAVLAASSGRAAEDPNECNRGPAWDNDGPVSLAKVTGQSRTYFIHAKPGCPANTAACRDKAYVVPGDLVVVSKTKSGFVCAVFPNKLGGQTGWLRGDQVMLLPGVPSTPLSAWRGRWSEDEQDDYVIEIKPKGARLAISGIGFWPGRGADEWPTSIPGQTVSTNTGEFEGVASPTGNRLSYRDGPGEYDCALKFDLLVPYLVVRDNTGCGGLNVNFTGVYQLRHARLAASRQGSMSAGRNKGAKK